jgi:type IV pilus assembly protein PilQ
LNAQIPESTISPLTGIRVGKHSDKIRLVLDLEEKTNFDFASIGNNIEISLVGGEAVAAALPSEAPPDTGEEGYIGKRISLDFQDADIVPLFRLFTDISGCNLAVNPQIKGKITLKLINVPWDQALDIILKTFSLSKIVDGNIIRIVPTADVAKELDELKKVQKKRAEAGELKTKIFPVNYADLSKLKAAIEDAKVLSSRGTITLDERGSSIIANDIEVNLEKIAALIADIDQEKMQARQVMIEAKIVEVTTDYTRDLGIQWGTNYTSPTASDTTTIGGTGQTGIAPSGNNFLVNLPAAVGTGSGGAIGFGYISKAANFALDVQLSALETNKKGKVLSTPRIMTMNNEEATITQGRTIYIPVATADKTDLKPIDALLSLKVTPRIAPGGAIFMKLDITKDEPGAATAGGVDVLKNTIKTNVLVNNGDTVVIGGIFKTSRTNTVDSVPGLSGIPVLGLLFKRNQNVTADTEVLIFITPKIVEFSSLK